MPKLPGVNHLDAVRALEKIGFRVVRQGRHIIMSDGQRRVVIPPQKEDYSTRLKLYREKKPYRLTTP